jgi:hypothetical protein
LQEMAAIVPSDSTRKLPLGVRTVCFPPETNVGSVGGAITDLQGLVTEDVDT